MLIIYHDVGGAHSTQVAAWVHLNRLPLNRIPSKEELVNIPLYDKIQKEGIGRILFAGKDEWDNQVYTLGRQYSEKITVKALEGLFAILKGDTEKLLLVSMKKTINLLMKIGGFSSRRLHLVSFGRPIVIKGTQQAYPSIVSLVSSVKSEIKQYNIEKRRDRFSESYDIPYFKKGASPS